MARLLVVAGVLAVCLPAWGQSDRFRAFTAKAARCSDRMQPVAATYFGSKGNETFTAVASQSDGTIVAFGNAWGPQFPGPVKPDVMGKGEWYQVSEFPDGKDVDENGKALSPSPDYPNLAGFIVFYSDDLQHIRHVVKFDWAVATIDNGTVAPDNGLIITGRCGPHFRKLAKTAEFCGIRPNPETGMHKNYGARYYDGIKLSGDIYVAKLTPDGKKLQWVWILEGYRDWAKTLWPLDNGGVMFDIRGLKRLSPDGRTLTDVTLQRVGGRCRLLTVNPATGCAVSGGDHNTSTGREPWRSPLLFGHRRDGQFAWQIYNWDSHLVGHDEYRLVSDSAIKGAVYDKQGNLLLSGWSDGGNSVLTRSPIDLDKPVKSGKFGMTNWGAGVLSCSYLIRIQPKTFAVLDWGLWLAYVPGPMPKGTPNSISIKQMTTLADGSIAITGNSADRLIQTPNSFVPTDVSLPDDELAYSGPYVAVFDKHLDNLRFSSYMPGCRIAGLAAAKRGLVVVSGSAGSDGRDKPIASPVVHAIQPAFAGGRLDGHILLLGSK